LKAKALAWSKLAAAKWEDAWVERLQCLGPGRLAIFTLPGSQRIRLEAYGLNKKEAGQLTKAFGGSVRPMKSAAAYLAGNGTAPPLFIRDRLVVVRSAKAAREIARDYPGRPILIIPAAMAFGTGDHATTSTCLRMICDIAGEKKNSGAAGARWEALDLGSGTGILALTARLMGASRCDAWDYDPACIQAIRDNVRANGMTAVPAARADVTQWAPSRQWDLITANLFSDLLIQIAPRIAAALKPNGRLILSGMLAPQAKATLAVFRAQGIQFEKVIQKGKWVTALSKAVG
jgi:ribosomal protein L11 methyltransferase